MKNEHSMHATQKIGIGQLQPKVSGHWSQDKKNKKKQKKKLASFVQCLRQC